MNYENGSLWGKNIFICFKRLWCMNWLFGFHIFTFYLFFLSFSLRTSIHELSFICVYQNAFLFNWFNWLNWGTAVIEQRTNIVYDSKEEKLHGFRFGFYSILENILHLTKIINSKLIVRHLFLYKQIWQFWLISSLMNENRILFHFFNFIFQRDGITFNVWV